MWKKKVAEDIMYLNQNNGFVKLKRKISQLII